MFSKLWKNKKAEVSKVITIIIALFVAGVLLPAALTELASGNYTGVNPAVKTIATVLLPILAIIAIVYIFLKKK
jgi:membrane protease YdiL (CAAX protease family)